MKRLLLTLTASLVLASTVFAADPDFNAILAKIDDQTNFKKTDISAQITVTTRKPSEPDNVLQAQYFRRDTEGKFLLLILKPEINKGQGYLKIDTNIFFYDPSSGKFAKQTGAGNFQDSNAKNSDFQNSTLSGDYTIEGSSTGALGKLETWILTLKGKTNEVTYPKQKIWVDKATGLLLQAEAYSLSDRLLRTSMYGKYLPVEGKYIAQLVRIQDELKKGEVTTIKIENFSPEKLADSVFSQAYLKKVNE
ncbi:MAG: outer membrane lipoprotein-sorting protein [Spirochaetales bacterium]